MKSTSLFIAITVLLHLVVLDLTLLLTSAEPSLIPLGAYNVIWLFIAVTVGTYKYKESRGN